MTYTKMQHAEPQRSFQLFVAIPLWMVVVVVWCQVLF